MAPHLPLSAPSIHRSSRPRFTLHLTLHDLNNVPLVSGTSFIKWHLPHSTSAEHRGRTAKCAIKDHRVTYNYSKSIPVALKVGKGGVLQECRLEMEVVQEYSKGGRGERIVLGEVGLNLAEYVTPSSAGGADDGTITRRYLMRSSKINSTLKISILMTHTSGPIDFTAPTLKSAPVFGGIAGIMNTSTPATSRPLPPQPNFSASSRETGEMQDMYRRTLAAFWSSGPGELRADECIEDIFAGGDGWGRKGRPTAPATSNTMHNGRGGGQGGSPMGSGTSTPNVGESQGGGGGGGGTGKRDLSSGGGGGGGMRPTWQHTHAQAYQGGGGGGGAGNHQRQASQGRNRAEMASAEARRREGIAGQLEEMDVREDLVSWRISEKAYL
ncbi:uncharacterized protein MYCGRDRAFT_71874 [Zymoseptoria tritici IPO323]|uniref:C2 NT-type domain-containing protein n=1 Tax=Zymoseptoria tritici (strain CBS 115943 / IPO323) TaxID=336722 RepID=F9XBB1_ZYMTI|nr:uncharacterized protein MYCGRDRAFT_71874 [Zymoseptoria tritici IPO323]EGP87090.1 hypothetical protein MYCGRDRAFT_71874 [Zymoseptoria tritici IPO323]